MSVEELEKAVAALPPDLLVQFRAWFEEFEAAHFDAKIEADIRSGKLDKFAEQALADVAAGRFRDL